MTSTSGNSARRLRLSAAMAGSIALLVVGGPARGEPENFNSDLFEASGYIRGEVAAADGRAANLPGPAGIWNGNAWWQLFTYCSNMHSVYGLRLEQTGAAPAELDEQERLYGHYQNLALGRLVADRSITEDAAWDEFVDPEGSYWTFSFLDTEINYDLEAMTCRFAEVRARS